MILLLAPVLSPLVGVVFLKADYYVDGCGLSPDDCAVPTVASAITASMLFILQVAAFNVPSDPSVTAAAGMFQKAADLNPHLHYDLWIRDAIVRMPQ